MLIPDTELYTWIWWATLSIATLAQAGFAVHRFATAPALPLAGQRLVLKCATIFACGVVYRSVFPLRYASRPHACLFEVDPWRAVGSCLGDRLAAQTCEVSLSLAFATMGQVVYSSLRMPRLAAISRALFWPIVSAQLCCWIGVATDNKWWHIIEESQVRRRMHHSPLTTKHSPLSHPVGRHLPRARSAGGLLPGFRRRRPAATARARPRPEPAP